MVTLQNNKTFALFVALLVAILLLLQGCSTLHKIKTSEVKKTDSTVHNVINKATVNNVDSTTIKKDVSGYNNTITVVFDTTRPSPKQETDTTGDWDIQSAIDYLDKPKQTTVTVNGNTITSDIPIRQITVNISGHDSSINIGQFTKHDSSVDRENDNTKLVKSDTEKNKAVQRTGLSIWVYIIGGLAIVGTILYLYSGGWVTILNFFKRKNTTT